jgi:hypothetical protein
MVTPRENSRHWPDVAEHRRAELSRLHQATVDLRTLTVGSKELIASSREAMRVAEKMLRREVPK